MNSTPTGMSVSCSGVIRSVNGIVTSGRRGSPRRPGTPAPWTSPGARMNTTLSAAVGMMSSLSASLTPSARDCSSPKGPCTLGPMRCCIRATTRRSNQMLNSVSTTRMHEDQHGLEDHHPERVLAERRQVLGGADDVDGGHRDQRAHAPTPSVDGEPAGRSRQHPTTRGVVGAHTTSSGRSATADRAGDHDPWPAVSVTGWPATSPSRASVGGGHQRDRVRAVARRYSSPSCIRPSSIISFQVASRSVPSGRVGAGTGARDRRAADRLGPRRRPRRRARPARPAPARWSGSRGRRPSRRRCRRAPGASGRAWLASRAPCSKRR